MTDSSFSGGEGVGYLGRSLPSAILISRRSLNLWIREGHGGSVAITVQGSGAAQWVALYYANGDSTWRNVTVR